MAEETSDFLEQKLADMQLFRKVDIKSIAPLLRACPVRTLKPQEVLIEAGRANQYLYLLFSGCLSVRLKTVDSDALTLLYPGESVGELSLIDKQPTSAFVVAEEQSEVLVIDEELVWILANTSHAVSSNLLYTLAQRMRYGNQVVFDGNEKLQKYQFHATVDGLTGLFNRYWLKQMLPRQMDRSRTSREPMSLIMADVDHFKNYNDYSGHVAGDRALCSVGASLRDSIRPADMAARYGGEEFIVLLPNSDLSAARLVAERLRMAVAQTAIFFENGAELPGVTASFGIAEMVPDIDAESFLSATDAALYRAKHAGRNQVAQ